MSENDKTDISASKGGRQTVPGLFQIQNRGTLLDITILFVNAVAVTVFSPHVASLSRSALDGDVRAQNIIVIPLMAMFILPPVAAVLKRCRFHERKGDVKNIFEGLDLAALFLIAFPYIMVQVFMLLAIVPILWPSVWSDISESTGVFLVLGIIILSFGTTSLIFLYFKKPYYSSFEFLYSPRTELVADIFIFINMIIYQLAWNHFVLTQVGNSLMEEQLSVSVLVTSFVLITVLAMAMYLPPRIFYLAEDYRKGRVWFTIFLANAPIILRILTQTGNSNGIW